MDQEQNEFYASCDKRGEQEVRNILNRKGWNERRTAWAHAWLKEQEASVENRRHRDTLSTNRSAATAAWVSAAAAVLALIVSIVALIRTFP